MKITTKIAKNGAVNIYLDGKRVKEEIAVDTLCDNGGKIYFADIHGYTGHTITATFASSISAYKWLIKMGNKSINYADGSWLIDCKDYKTGEIVTILEKDERDYVINDPQLKAFCNGEILEVTQEVVTDDDIQTAEQEPQVAVNAAKAELQADTEPEVDPSEYAINPDALEVAVNAEIQNANDVRVAALAGITAKEYRTEMNDIMAGIRAATFKMNLNSLKKQMADTVKEIASRIRHINYNVWDYLRGNPNNDVSEDGLNNSAESLVEDLNKLADLKAQLANLAPYEVYDTNAAINAEIQAQKDAIQKDATEILANIERYEILSTPLTTQDALEVAVNAEIQNANNAKINDIKWEIRYVEGSINDLDQNHIAHAPNDQSLQERRAELVNELDNLNAQLAELLPTEHNTNSEYKYYLQSRRPIAGAVPNGYISATQGEMKVHSLRSDGSISVVPRKVVFGVVVYDHPLSDQQIINYDLHVDPLNPKVELDTKQVAELSDTEPDTEPQVAPIITDRNDNLIADHITGIKEESQMQNSEWYTPPTIINAARQVLTTIDLDPASCALANLNVKAKNFYTTDDDALTQDWFGNVWLNPPYSRNLIEKFADKVISQYLCGNINSAIVLTGACTETKWFVKLAHAADATCFLTGRVKFLQPDGTPCKDNFRNGSCLFYFGTDTEKFLEVFKPLGLCTRFEMDPTRKGGEVHDDRRFGTARYGRYSRWLCLRVRPAAASFKAYSATFRRTLPSRR